MPARRELAAATRLAACTALRRCRGRTGFAPYVAARGLRPLVGQRVGQRVGAGGPTYVERLVSGSEEGRYVGSSRHSNSTPADGARSPPRSMMRGRSSSIDSTNGAGPMSPLNAMAKMEAGRAASPPAHSGRGRRQPPAARRRGSYARQRRSPMTKISDGGEPRAARGGGARQRAQRGGGAAAGSTSATPLRGMCGRLFRCRAHRCSRCSQRRG